MTTTKARKYHGWIVVEAGGSGFNNVIWVEWRDKPEDEVRSRKQVGYGETGSVTAVEWWDKKVGQSVKLQPMLKGSYRVYTEEGGAL